MSSPFERFPTTACLPLPGKNPTPDLPLVARALETLLELEPHGSPLRYPLRVALQFARMGVELAASQPPADPPGPAWADFDPASANTPSFAAIVGLIGPGLAVLLIGRYCNARLYIPGRERLHEGHGLARAIGYPDALKLAQEYGGQSVKVPSGHWAVLHARNAQIAERYARGEPAARLAREYGVAEDSVYRIVNRARHGEVEPLAWPERFETLDLFADDCR